MRSLALSAAVGLAFLASSAPAAARAQTPDVGCFVSAYPGYLCGVAGEEVTLCAGGTLPRAHLADMLSEPYPPVGTWPPRPDGDPGRIRHEPFFEGLYGATAAEVESRLVAVRWFGRVVRVTRAAGAADRLRAVRDELARLPRRFQPFFRETAGTFVWRTIHGSTWRSMHSYGIAIDVGVPRADYWRWVPGATRSEAAPAYRNRFPREVVDVFERHGFIWGGRWQHFDTMHFEFRPELLCDAARRLPRSPPGREAADLPQ